MEVHRVRTLLRVEVGLQLRTFVRVEVGLQLRTLLRVEVGLQLRNFLLWVVPARFTSSSFDGVKHCCSFRFMIFSEPFLIDWAGMHEFDSQFAMIVTPQGSLSQILRIPCMGGF